MLKREVYPGVEKRELCAKRRSVLRENEHVAQSGLSLSSSRFTVGVYSPPSLCHTALCSGIMRLSSPFHCWVNLPVSLVGDILPSGCASPVSLVG